MTKSGARPLVGHPVKRGGGNPLEDPILALPDGGDSGRYKRLAYYYLNSLLMSAYF